MSYHADIKGEEPTEDRHDEEQEVTEHELREMEGLELLLFYTGAIVVDAADGQTEERYVKAKEATFRELTRRLL